MRLAPNTKEAILQLAAATLAPVVPLALTVMPLEELLKKLFGILLRGTSRSACTMTFPCASIVRSSCDTTTPSARGKWSW